MSPDGSRLVYSSYLGRSWHNLWVMPAGGGDAFPIGYGDWDQTYPRWSPDGTRIAFISNQNGNTEIGIVRIPGGVVETLASGERHYLKSMARLHLDLKDCEGQCGIRARQHHRCGRALLRAGQCLDQRGRLASIASHGRSRRIIFTRTAKHGSTCRRGS